VIPHRVVPGRAHLTQALAAAALVLAVSSRGELALVALLLVLPDVSVPSVVAALGAVVASSWRWGTTSLEALAGAQAVLGPAGGIGPGGAAAGSWLAAAALLLALSRGRDPMRFAAVGATVAAVLAGPAPGGELPVRVAVALGASVAAYGLASWRAEGGRGDRLVAWLGALAGLGALVAVAAADEAQPASVELGLVGQGAAIAVAVGAVVLVALRVRTGARWRDRGAWPTVKPRLVASPAPPDPHHR
jgi:hypothetical protein